MKPIVHARNSVKRYGGIIEDYLDIHEFMDSSKSCLAMNIHRFLLHNSFAIKTIIPKIFGHTRTNSDGKEYIPENIAEQHVLEDFGMRFIPTPQDYLEHVKMQPWMNNGPGFPSSSKGLTERQKD